MLRPNKIISVFRVSGPNLNLLVKTRMFSGLLEKKYNFMHFERRNAFQNALNYIFSEIKIIKKLSLPTLPKIIRPVTQNTLIFVFGFILIVNTHAN